MSFIYYLTITNGLAVIYDRVRETILQDFSRLQTDFSRAPKFTLTLSLLEATNNLFLLTISTHCQTYK